MLLYFPKILLKSMKTRIENQLDKNVRKKDASEAIRTPKCRPTDAQGVPKGSKSYTPGHHFFGFFFMLFQSPPPKGVHDPSQASPGVFAGPFLASKPAENRSRINEKHYPRGSIVDYFGSRKWMPEKSHDNVPAHAQTNTHAHTYTHTHTHTHTHTYTHTHIQLHSHSHLHTLAHTHTHTHTRTH